jgi:hypothetical protein
MGQLTRPPLEADATPIGRDWVEYANALEARVRELEGLVPANEETADG